MKPSAMIISLLVIFTICALLFIVGYWCGHATNTDNYYGMTAVVVDISRPLDRVTIEDCNGNLWQFDGVEDYDIGDICSCVMNNCGTDNITDDEIVSVQYGGYFEGWED